MGLQASLGRTADYHSIGFGAQVVVIDSRMPSAIFSHGREPKTSLSTISVIESISDRRERHQLWGMEVVSIR
jgi:hypothetical protein